MPLVGVGGIALLALGTLERMSRPGLSIALVQRLRLIPVARAIPFRHGSLLRVRTCPGESERRRGTHV